ncbi:MAG: hypothetical protein ACKOC5_15310 [Chloroflexota bacterium]
MRKVQFYTVLWTFVLAVPLTALGIAQAAYLTDRLGEFIRSLTGGQPDTLGGLGWLAEFSARWPEVAGMIVGFLVMLAILLVDRSEKAAETKVPR